MKGRGAAIGQWVTAGTIIVGSLLYVVAPVAPFFALLGSRLLTLLVVLTMPKTARYADDPSPSDGGDDDTITAADTLPIIRDRLLTPPLRPFVAYVALFVATAMTAGIFIQPITVEALEGPVGRILADNGVPEPATLGLLYAAFTGVAALASDRASDLEDWLGVRRALLVVPLAIAVLLVVPVALPLLAFPVFFGLKAGQSMVRPIVGQYLNDHLASVGRATVLSAVSMVYAVLRIPYSLGAGTLADATSPVTTVAVLGGVFVVVGGALFAFGRPVRTRTDAPVGETPAD